MITITKIEQQFKPDGKPSGYKVNLSDGTFGYLVEKESDKDLKDGEVVTYTAETPAGKTYKKLTVKREGQSSSATPQQQSSQPAAKMPSTFNVAQMRFDARMKCLELANNAFVAGKLDDAQAKEHAAAWIVMADSLINEIYTK